MTNMDEFAGPHTHGPFEARYLAFLETITHLGPSLHRYCTRMTGSVMDGRTSFRKRYFMPTGGSTHLMTAARWRHGCSESRTISASISCAAAKLARRQRLPCRNRIRLSARTPSVWS